MFNALFSACKSMFDFHGAVEDIAHILVRLEEDYTKDQNAKDAAIDAICEILQSHKSTVEK